MNKKTICFVAGKSGGHIIPCLTIINPQQHPHVLFFSTNRLLDKKIISTNPHVTWHIALPLVSFIPSKLLSYPLTAWHFFYSIMISFFYLYKTKPIEIITTGGIVAIPVCIAAYTMRIPITLYALDAVAGKALKKLAPLATTINHCFTSAQQYFPKNKCVLTHYPIKFSHADKAIDKKKACTLLGLNEHKKTVLFLGGSQGSLFLNQCARKLVENPSFSSATTQIIHQTGTIDSTNWSSFYKNKNVSAHIFSYTNHIATMYAAADHIVCRAGAGTLFEIVFFEKKCIVIPLKTESTDHQIDNACAITDMYPNFFSYILQKEVESDYNSFISKLL